MYLLRLDTIIGGVDKMTYEIQEYRICKYCWGRFKEEDVEHVKKEGYVCKNCKERLEEN